MSILRVPAVYAKPCLSQSMSDKTWLRLAESFGLSVTMTGNF